MKGVETKSTKLSLKKGFISTLNEYYCFFSVVTLTKAKTINPLNYYKLVNVQT